MRTLLSKVFPAKKGLMKEFEALQEKVDHGGLSEGEANIAMAKTLAKKVTESLGEASPECFSVWLKEAGSEKTALVGWCSSREKVELKSELGEGVAARHRVIGTARPMLLQDESEVLGLLREITTPGSEIPGNWTRAALAPIEKAGESLGISLAFFSRPLEEDDLEGMIRLCDLIGSFLFTGEDGLPVLP